MARFKGQASYSVDSKGRVAIPAKMRSSMNPEAKSTFTITRGIDQCIYLYPLDTWEQMEDDMSGLNMFRSEDRIFVRTIMMWADEATLDGQGRIGIPKQLMEFAGITDRAHIIGALDRIEVWDPDLFEAHLNAQTEKYETIAERVMGIR